HNIVGCRWIFSIKKNPDGTVKRLKSRLVARGFTQRFGTDYNSTFAPVVSLGSLRVLLSFAVQSNMHVHQIDVTTAFLHGDLAETIYMQQPPGYVDVVKQDHVCLLKKAIYGLKQAGRQWNIKLKQVLIKFGFQQFFSDLCMFIYNGTRAKL